MEETTPTLESLKQAVADLRTAVEQRAEGKQDEEVVRRIAAEVVEQQLATAPELQKRNGGGYKPVDEDGNSVIPETLGQGKEALTQLLTLPARDVAPLARRDEAEIAAFQQANDRILIIAAARGVEPQETKYFKQRFAPMVQALSAGGAGTGADYVPTELSADMIERITLELRVAALFPQIDMPTNPFNIVGRQPKRTRTARGLEQTADTGQTGFSKRTPATRKVTLTAVKFDTEMLVSKEAEEDAIVAMLPFMEEEAIDWIAGDIEDALLNGDTAAALDNDFAADDPRRNWDGLRKVCPAGAKIDGAGVALTVALLRGNRAKMGKYGVVPTKLAHVVSINNYIQLLADPSVITMEKYGPNATIFAGELGKADGIPIVVSEYQRTDLNVAGAYDNVTKTRSVAVTVHQSGFLRGIRRGMTIQVLRELYAEDDQDAILASTRLAFSPRFPLATENVVAETYNLLS
jgi:HK97 family phage major capsid protein